MIYPRRQVPLRTRIPTVLVTLSTDDGEVSVRARWNHRPIDLQRRILFLMRQGHPIFLEDEWGHGVCLRPECVWSARVDGRTSGGVGDGATGRTGTRSVADATQLRSVPPGR